MKFNNSLQNDMRICIIGAEKSGKSTFFDKCYNYYHCGNKLIPNDNNKFRAFTETIVVDSICVKFTLIDVPSVESVLDGTLQLADGIIFVHKYMYVWDYMDLSFNTDENKRLETHINKLGYFDVESDLLKLFNCFENDTEIQFFNLINFQEATQRQIKFILEKFLFNIYKNNNLDVNTKALDKYLNKYITQNKDNSNLLTHSYNFVKDISHKSLKLSYKYGINKPYKYGINMYNKLFKT